MNGQSFRNPPIFCCDDSIILIFTNFVFSYSLIYSLRKYDVHQSCLLQGLCDEVLNAKVDDVTRYTV